MNYYRCSFCPDTELVYGTMINGYSSGIVPKISCNMYCCQQCESNFFYLEYKLIGWFFRKNCQGTEYHVVWFEETGQTVIRKNWEIIVTFDGQMRLTPNNLEQRLPTILTFL